MRGEQNLSDVLDLELSHLDIKLSLLEFLDETKRRAVPLQRLSLTMLQTYVTPPIQTLAILIIASPGCILCEIN